MALSRAKFQALAARLIDDKFADFRNPLAFVVTTDGVYDPVTETTTGGDTVTYTYQAIPQPIDIKEWQGTDVQLTDIALVYTRADAFEPKISDTCTYKGLDMQVKSALLDAADATVKLVIRAL